MKHLILALLKPFDVDFWVRNRQDLQMSHISRSGMLLRQAILLMLFVTPAWYFSFEEGYQVGLSNGNVADSYETPVVIQEDTSFSEEALVSLIKQTNISFPHIVYAQAVVESGPGKSQLFISNHNLFGMREAKQRPNTNTGTENNHATYPSWRESVYDYALWQAHTQGAKLKTDDEYYQFLSSAGYATDSTYTATLRQVVENLKLKDKFK